MVARGGIFIGLGSNLGDRERYLREALRLLAERGDIRVLACSSWHETDPVEAPPGSPSFLNGAAEIDTPLDPHALLARLQAVEDRLGRVRTGVVNEPRTIDLDLLFYRRLVVDDDLLSVPHPRMWQRTFVMKPLAEICDLDRLVTARRLRCRQPAPEAAEHVCGC
jgi:2-amino-4-hydroxy-6-hydroxymethyldihydropteridine diphosphokinase